MKDALDTTHEIIKRIKYFPHREAIFKDLKKVIPGESSWYPSIVSNKMECKGQCTC